jgi:hypothetical protein
MCNKEKLQEREERQTKKPYVRPQLVKHGSVETLTQHFNWEGFSSFTYNK